MVSFKRHENKAKMDGWVGIHKVPNRQEQTSWLHRCRPCLTLCVVSTWMLVLPHSPVLKDLQTKPERVHKVSWNQILVWVSTAQRHCVTQCSPLLHAVEMKEKAHWVLVWQISSGKTQFQRNGRDNDRVSQGLFTPKESPSRFSSQPINTKH